LPDPDATPPRSESGLLDLFAEIRVTVDQEAQIVKAVFPHPPVVMQVFLQRVFAQSVRHCPITSFTLTNHSVKIQQYMEQLLNRGTAVSDLAYLRVLQLVHIQASLLVDDLKAYEHPTGIPRSPTEGADLRRSLSGGSAASGAGASAAVSTLLETSLEELFVPYTEGQRYLERESRSLGTLYSGLLVNFTRYHVRPL
jgi:hypothetical protein